MCYVRYAESSRRLRISGKSSWEITEPLTTGLSRRVYREIRVEHAQVHKCRPWESLGCSWETPRTWFKQTYWIKKSRLLVDGAGGMEPQSQLHASQRQIDQRFEGFSGLLSEFKLILGNLGTARLEVHRELRMQLSGRALSWHI